MQDKCCCFCIIRVFRKKILTIGISYLYSILYIIKKCLSKDKRIEFGIIKHEGIALQLILRKKGIGVYGILNSNGKEFQKRNLFCEFLDKREIIGSTSISF